MAKKPTDESKGKEVEVVVDQTELDAQFKEEKKDSKAVNSSLKEVIENLKDQTEQGKKVAQGQLDLAEMDKKIAALQGGLLGASTENAAALREQFTALQNAITASGGVSTPEQTDMIDSLKEGVESEEEKREKKKQLEKQNSALGKLSAGLEGFDKTLNGMLDGAGKAAFGVGALALIFSPETFLKVVTGIIEFLQNAANAIGKLLDKDIFGFLEIFKENFLSFSLAIFVLAAKFKVITKISAGIAKAQELYQKALALTQSKFVLKTKELMKSFGAKTGITKALMGLKKAAMAMRAKVIAQAKGMLASAKSLGKGMIKKLVFAAKALRAKIVASSAGLLTTAKTLALGALKKLSFAAGALKGAMLAASKGLLSFLAPIAVAIKGFVIAGAVAAKGLVLAAAPLLAAAAPFLAIAAGIALVIGGIVSAFSNIKKRFESTGSILETIGGFILDITTFPATFLKNVVASIAGFFGFDGLAKAIKDFNITDFILGGIKKVIGFVADLFTFEMPKFNFSIVDSILEFFGMIKDAILDFIPSWDEIKAKLNPFNWFSDDGAEEEKQVTKAKKSAAEKRETAVENAAESVALEVETSTDSEKRKRGGPSQERKKDVGAPAPIIEFNPAQVMTVPEPMPEREPVVINETDSPELKEAKTVLVESQTDLEDYKERQSYTAFPDSPELQASETKYYESVVKEITAKVQQLETPQEQATKPTAERKTVNVTPMKPEEAPKENLSFFDRLLGTDKNAKISTPFTGGMSGLSPEQIQGMMEMEMRKSPIVEMGSALFDKASGFIGRMFGGNEETPEVTQQRIATVAEQSFEALLPNSPVNQLRDTQVESIGLMSQEKQEAASNNNAVMVAATGGKKVQSTNNVSSKTVNITNDVSMDSLLREFAYNPNG
jgi:hypothetical protein